ncbi:Clavaminate synthase-like protein [Gloeopeniophorella convolvens]|nr:Clavaminate synthase-like protein [Gloeopeniophorella convolvens]
MEPPNIGRNILQWISSEYHELNGGHHDILESPPSPVEFARICHISRPVLIKGYAIPSTRRWSNRYLIDTMGDSLLSVAVTPDGYADAVTRGADGKWYFAEPCSQKMTMGALLSKLGQPSKTNGEGPRDNNVYYLQSQNGNIFSSGYFTSPALENDCELTKLRNDVPSEIPWCSEALGRCPDAVNLWIGDGNSVTSIHSDPYENIYHVVRGSKTFLLLPPTEGWCLQERLYPHATYQHSSTDASLTQTPSPSGTPPVRWSSISHPEREGSLPDAAHPIVINVRAGETLYLPAGWWHHVRQSKDTTIALNWWYDIEAQGSAWVWLRFLRPVDVPVAEEVGEKSDV